MLALVAVYDSGVCNETAKIGGMPSQIVRGWMT